MSISINILPIATTSIWKIMCSIRSLRLQHLFCDTEPTSTTKCIGMRHIIWPHNRPKLHFLRKNQKSHCIWPRSIIQCWQSKIHIQKMFLRPYHFWKKNIKSDLENFFNFHPFLQLFSLRIPYSAGSWKMAKTSWLRTIVKMPNLVKKSFWPL